MAAEFLLTAIPNWTGRLPVRELRLAILGGLWLLGRVACLISADPHAQLAISARESLSSLTSRHARDCSCGFACRRANTGRELMANRARVAVFVLINAAAIIRVCASWHTEFMTILLLVAGACWNGAFGLFELVYGPMRLTRRSTS